MKRLILFLLLIPGLVFAEEAIEKRVSPGVSDRSPARVKPKFKPMPMQAAPIKTSKPTSPKPPAGQGEVEIHGLVPPPPDDEDIEIHGIAPPTPIGDGRRTTGYSGSSGRSLTPTDAAPEPEE